MHCTRDQWAEKYGSGARYWEQDTAHPLFYSSMKKVGVKPGATVFFPMCGKTVEMKQLYDQGYNVVGKGSNFKTYFIVQLFHFVVHEIFKNTLLFIIVLA